MKIHYNSPVILTFSIIAVLVFILSAIFSQGITSTFSPSGQPFPSPTPSTIFVSSPTSSDTPAFSTCSAT